jgi:hypothetical protein
MSDLYNYNFLKILTERSIDIIDSKTLLTYGMIGVTCVVLAAATIYEQIEDSQEGLQEGLQEVLQEQLGEENENVFETPREENNETTGGKSKKKRRTKRKYKN